MSFAPVDYEDCGEKCRCQQGINEGTVYNKANPCEEGFFFKEDECDCVSDIPCDTTFSLNGRQGQFSDNYIVGNPNCPQQDGPNILEFTWEAFRIPDAFEVSGGATYSTNGLVSGGQTVYLPLSSDTITVSVIGSEEGTAWRYKLLRNCGPCDGLEDDGGGGE